MSLDWYMRHGSGCMGFPAGSPHPPTYPPTPPHPCPVSHRQAAETKRALAEAAKVRRVYKCSCGVVGGHGCARHGGFWQHGSGRMRGFGLQALVSLTEWNTPLFLYAQQADPTHRPMPAPAPPAIHTHPCNR